MSGWRRACPGLVLLFLPSPPPRSHPTILDVPNRLYYDGELQACADVVDRERFCRWEGLPRQVRLSGAGAQAPPTCTPASLLLRVWEAGVSEWRPQALPFVTWDPPFPGRVWGWKGRGVREVQLKVSPNPVSRTFPSSFTV